MKPNIYIYIGSRQDFRTKLVNSSAVFVNEYGVKMTTLKSTGNTSLFNSEIILICNVLELASSRYSGSEPIVFVQNAKLLYMLNNRNIKDPELLERFTKLDKNNISFRLMSERSEWKTKLKDLCK